MKLGWGTTETPNMIFEALPEMSTAELLCTLVLVRETYGCDRRQVRMTYADFMRLTGIGSKATVAPALEAIEARGFFRRVDDRSIWEVCEVGETGVPRSI
jgi:hypothetical protein